MGNEKSIINQNNSTANLAHNLSKIISKEVEGHPKKYANADIGGAILIAMQCLLGLDRTVNYIEYNAPKRSKN